MPFPNPVTKGETMASSRSQELPLVRELVMVSPLVTGLERGMVKESINGNSLSDG